MLTALKAAIKKETVLRGTVSFCSHLKGGENMKLILEINGQRRSLNRVVIAALVVAAIALFGDAVVDDLAHAYDVQQSFYQADRNWMK